MRILCRRDMAKNVFAAVVAVCLGGTSFAFEHRGFHSGMTLDQVVTKAKSEGVLLAPIEGTDSGYSFGLPDGPGPNTLFFCDGLLFRLTAGFLGGVPEFVQSAEQFIEVKGNPTVHSTSTFTSAGNLSSQILLSWVGSGGSDTVELYLTDHLHKAYSGVSYTSRSVCGDP